MLLTGSSGAVMQLYRPWPKNHCCSALAQCSMIVSQKLVDLLLRSLRVRIPPQTGRLSFTKTQYCCFFSFSFFSFSSKSFFSPHFLSLTQCLSLCLSISQSLNLSLSLIFYLSISLSLSFSHSLFLTLSIYPSIYPSTYLYIYLSICKFCIFLHLLTAFFRIFRRFFFFFFLLSFFSSFNHLSSFLMLVSGLSDIWRHLTLSVLLEWVVCLNEGFVVVPGGQAPLDPPLLHPYPPLSLFLPLPTSYLHLCKCVRICSSLCVPVHIWACLDVSGHVWACLGIHVRF